MQGEGQNLAMLIEGLPRPLERRRHRHPHPETSQIRIR